MGKRLVLSQINNLGWSKQQASEIIDSEVEFNYSKSSRLFFLLEYVAIESATTLNNPNTDETEASYEIDFRPALDEDIPAIQELLDAYVAQKKLLRRTRQELAMLVSNGFVATVDEKLVGFSAVEIYSRKLGEIQCLAVEEGYQGQGIGSELVALCVQRAREKGIMEVMAISSSEHFLRKLGFDYALPDQKRALFFQLRSRDEFSKESADEK